MRTRLGQLLDVFTNISIIVVAGVLAFVLIRSVNGKRGPSPFTNRSAAHSIGEVLPALQGITWAAADKNLVLYLNPHCSYCTTSMPFYQTLARSARDHHVRVLAVSQYDAELLKKYLEAHGLRNVPAIQASAVFRVPGTPTVILCDRNARVLREWVGTLSAPAQDQIRHLLSS